MSFILGLDVGTAAGAAATKQDGHVQPCELGESGPTVPSVVVLHDDGTFLTGEDAQRGAGWELVRIARDLRRDPMLQADPIVVGGQVSTPYNMLRALYTGLVERVCQTYGEVPTHVVVTHPALPDGLRCDIVERIADELFPGALLVPEPVAAAVKLACDSVLPTEGNIVVYDLGGGTLDLALVRRDGDRFSILGEPSGMTEFGGIDIDDMVLGHVDASLNGAIAHLDLADPVALTTLDRLRAECRRAKEHLSVNAEVSIDASLAGDPALVTMRRHELEELLFPRIEASMDVVEQMVGDAFLSLADIDAVALVGGSARIPLVAELIRARVGLPVVVDEAPDLTAALGAAQMVDDDAAAASVFPIAGAPLAREPAGVGAGSGGGGGGGGGGELGASAAPAAAPERRWAPASHSTTTPGSPLSSTTAREQDTTRVGGAPSPATTDGLATEPEAEEAAHEDEYSEMFGQKTNPRIRNALVGGSAALLLAAAVLVGLRNTSSTVSADQGASGPIGPETTQTEGDDDRGRAAADDEDDDDDTGDEDDDEQDDDRGDEDDDETERTSTTKDDDSGTTTSSAGKGTTTTSGGNGGGGGSTTSKPPWTPRPTTTTTKPTTTTSRPTTTTTTTTSPPTTTTTTTTPPDPPGDG